MSFPLLCPATVQAVCESRSKLPCQGVPHSWQCIIVTMLCSLLWDSLAALVQQRQAEAPNSSKQCGALSPSDSQSASKPHGLGGDAAFARHCTELSCSSPHRAHRSGLRQPGTTLISWPPEQLSTVQPGSPMPGPGQSSIQRLSPEPLKVLLAGCELTTVRAQKWAGATGLGIDVTEAALSDSTHTTKVSMHTLLISFIPLPGLWDAN